MSSDFKKRIRSRIPNPSKNTITREFQCNSNEYINKNILYNNKVYIFDRKIDFLND